MKAIRFIRKAGRIIPIKVTAELAGLGLLAAPSIQGIIGLGMVVYLHNYKHSARFQVQCIVKIKTNEARYSLVFYSYRVDFDICICCERGHAIQGLCDRCARGNFARYGSQIG